MTTITTLPTAPSRADPSTFSSRADAFVAALPTFGTQANALASEVNAWASSASSSAAIAIASANFKGAWSSLTGALAVPASVLHSSQLWLLVSNVADVTAHTPGVSASWVNLETIQNDGLGYNQTWQNVKASRALSTTYTNSTSRPIMVNITITSPTDFTSILGTLTVDSVIVAACSANTEDQSFENIFAGSVSAVVPVGSSYSFAAASGDASNIYYWAELR